MVRLAVVARVEVTAARHARGKATFHACRTAEIQAQGSQRQQHTLTIIRWLRA
jgi:hypothetical protein